MEQRKQSPRPHRPTAPGGLLAPWQPTPESPRHPMAPPPRPSAPTRRRRRELQFFGLLTAR